MKKGYSCHDGKYLNIVGENITGLYEEPYISFIEVINFCDISAHRISLDYSVFKNLRQLTIRSYEPYTFPKEICYLPQLEFISCNAKCLIPPEIGEMASLQRLNLHGDCVSRIPKSIINARAIKNLSLTCYSELNSCQMPGWITSLTQLEELFLDRCNFLNIDTKINNLINLRTLCIRGSLSAVNNFPELVNLKKLDRLEITGSGLMKKRPSYSIFEMVKNGITKLNTLTLLSLSDWRFGKKEDNLIIDGKGRSLPDIFEFFPKLTVLDINNMNIDFLPPSIFKLPVLRNICTVGNNLSEECLKHLLEAGFEFKNNYGWINKNR